MVGNPGRWNQRPGETAMESQDKAVPRTLEEDLSRESIDNPFLFNKKRS